MKFSRIHQFTFFMIVMSVLVSCRDELCYNHYASIDVIHNWEQEWERDYGMNHSETWDNSRYGCDYQSVRPEQPEWVNVIRFIPDGSRYEHYIGNEGDRIVVNEGDGQSLLLYNGDTQYIVLSDIATPPMARASATSRTRTSLSYVSQLHSGARTTNPPDVLYAAYIPNLKGVKKHEVMPLKVNMHPMVYTYLIRYEIEYGLDYVALARGALAGMAESVYLTDGHTSDNSSIILYDCELKDFGCDVSVKSFGVPNFPADYYGRADDNSNHQPFTLNLELRLKNGKYKEFNYDISDQIANQPRGGVITVSGIRVEDEEAATSSGFDVIIDDWGERVDIDLPTTPDQPATGY